MNNNQLSFPNGFEKTEVRWEKIKIKLAPNGFGLGAVAEASARALGLLSQTRVIRWHG